ncbi:hypothetical protein P171DRAFT_244386 [Karstenula rhodostoma CBS 690.94]|uniref:Uncharacterized protein n=1 Tax=Karstenula rhodostoma CBS 690.94 TaxID=1392251 RepID=A0A9P4PQI2_9PLEO|nr:hypothetical protein P171DRAFT_244386 [Karstenula rhodostoma CBS 690.94]
MCRPCPRPRIGHCGAWLCVSTKPGIKNSPGTRWCTSASSGMDKFSSLDFSSATITPSASTISVPFSMISTSPRLIEWTIAPWKTLVDMLVQSIRESASTPSL